MNVSVTFTRILFAILSIFFLTIYMISGPDGASASKVALGVFTGLVLISVLFAFDIVFRRYNLRSFNTVTAGLFVGYLMGQALVLIFNAILGMSRISVFLTPAGLEVIRICLLLFGTYVGTMMTLRAAESFLFSIPFIKFSSLAQRKKDLLVDASILVDARILDICSTGIFDNHLVIPRFVIKALYGNLESNDPVQKERARRGLEVLRKLESSPTLALRFTETDFPEIHDSTRKLLRLARASDANVLTADISRVQMASIEGVRVVNIHSLASALKPLMEAGEMMKVKVQRYGKEPKQGVGYLDDGTMVVINGGGDFVGNQVPAQVLSVKHTSSGRIVFCNLMEESGATS